MRTLRLSLVGTIVLSLLGAVPALAEEEAPTPGDPRAGDLATGSVAWVTGTANCPTANLGQSSTDADDVLHFRDGAFTCIMRMDDPRVSGTHTTTTWNADLWGESVAQAEVVQWATVRLENDGGAWEGWLTGVASLPEPGDIIVIWYEGTGGYAGLSYFEQWTDRDPWTIEGLIFPGEPPARP